MKEIKRVTAEGLRDVLQRAYCRVNPELMRKVYGEHSAEDYTQEKWRKYLKYGFLHWFCDLDINNAQRCIELLYEEGK